MFSWLKRKKGILTSAVLIAVMLSLLGVRITDRDSSDLGQVQFGVGNEKVITLGYEALAAGSLDYTFDGVDDDVQLQAALDALPATGGRLVIVSAVQINLSNTVSRAIDNVIIEGAGDGTYFVNDGVTSIFSAGTQDGWVFRDFSTDAGGINYLTSTNYVLENVTLGGVYHAYRTDASADEWAIPTGRGATFIVAASDSSANSKAQVDYVCDGTDDQVEIQAAIDALPAIGGRVLLLEGTFTMAAGLSWSTDNVVLEGQGEATVLDFTAIASGFSGIEILGSLGASEFVTADISNADNFDVTVADGSTFAEGDFVKIYSDDLWVDGVAKIGELAVIDTIVGDVLTMKSQIIGSWQLDTTSYQVVSNAVVQIVNMVKKPRVINLRMEADSNDNNNTGIQLQYCYSTTIKGVEIVDFKQQGINAADCLLGSVTDGHVEGSNQGSLGYGIVIVDASRNWTIHNMGFERNRHATDCGGSTIPGIPRFITVSQCHSLSSTIHAFSTHVRGDFVTFLGNHVSGASSTGGIQISCPHSIVTDNKVEGGDANASQIDVQSTILSAIIQSNQLSGYCYSNIDVTGADGKVVIANNFIRSGRVANIYIKDSTGVNIQNNIFGIDSKLQLWVVDSSNISIDGNHFEGIVSAGNLPGIRIESTDTAMSNITITNNQIKDQGRSNHGGIEVLEAEGLDIDDVIIEGNRVWSTATNSYGLLITKFNGERYLISGNNFSGNQGGAMLLSGMSILDILYDQYSDLFMDVLAVSATHIRSNEDLSAATPITFTIDAQPDVPRTLSGHFDAHTNITAYTIEITGVDAKGNTVTEIKTDADGWDWETSNAFATITSIKMTERTGTGVGDTIDIGITDVLGLSNVIYETGDVYKIKKNNANAVVAGAQVDTDYDTYDMSVIGLANTDDFTIYYRSNLNIID